MTFPSMESWPSGFWKEEREGEIKAPKSGSTFSLLSKALPKENWKRDNTRWKLLFPIETSGRGYLHGIG